MSTRRTGNARDHAEYNRLDHTPPRFRWQSPTAPTRPPAPTIPNISSAARRSAAGQPIPARFPSRNAGETVITARTIDKVGNVGTEQTATVRIDAPRRKRQPGGQRRLRRCRVHQKLDRQPRHFGGGRRRLRRRNESGSAQNHADQQQRRLCRLHRGRLCRVLRRLDAFGHGWGKRRSMYALSTR